MYVSDYDTRRNRILSEIVEAYISTASPVGSEFLCKKIRQNLSSATIRNIMAELEEAGYLEQPHTSAGRVPTDMGWRFYVDALMKQASLSVDECQSLLSLINPDEEYEFDQFLERVSEVLAHCSNQAAFVVAPSVKKSRVKRIEFLPIGVRKLLCVFVAQEAMVVSHVVELEEPMTRDEAVSIAQFLNSELTGLPVLELLSSLNNRLLGEDDSFYHLIKRSLSILETALAAEPEERFYLEGVINLFEQPEFRKDHDKARRLLHELENQKQIIDRMRQDMEKEGTKVRIGKEVGIDGLRDCGYILSPFRINQRMVGCVGILGPKRMDYRRMRALVEGMSDLITETIAQWEE